MKHPSLYNSILLILGIMVTISLPAQNTYVHSREGDLLGRRVDMIVECIKKGGKEGAPVSTTAAICKCTVDLMNRNFTNEQLKRHTRNDHRDITGLFSEDSSFETRVRDCWTDSTQEKWVTFQKEYVTDCKRVLEEKTQRPLDVARADKFCRCQLDMILSNELPLTGLKELNDPNSALFHKVVQKCGSPFKE